MRICPVCLVSKPIEEFGRDASRADGRRSYCLPCHAEYMRNYNATHERVRNVEAERAYSARRNTEWKRRINKIKLWFGCADCGYRKRAVALDFDHRPGEVKLFSISKSTRAWHLVTAEMAKCDIVCANCHRIRTEDRLQ